VVVVALQFVPSARNMVPVPVAMEGYVAVLNEGSAAAPADCRTCPAVAVGPTPPNVLDVDEPRITAWFVTGVPTKAVPVKPVIPVVLSFMLFAATMVPQIYSVMDKRVVITPPISLFPVRSLLLRSC
jgi:hypothetical protein